MSTLISVIVPVYNVENYLLDCLNSIDENIRHFQDMEIEVIIVNDGSTDGSNNIINSFCTGRGEYKYYEQTNQGLSAARNCGMSHATGKYLFFLDSDDIIAERTLRDLYDFAEAHDCDICQCGILYYFGDGRDYISGDTNGFKSSCVISNETAIELFIDNYKIKSFACGKLYRRECIQNLLFPLGKFFEDIFWQPQVIGQSQRYGVLTKPLYFYRQRGESITGSFSSRKLDLLDGYVELCRYFRANFPLLYYKMVYRFWVTKNDFDHQLKASGIILNETELRRLNALDNYCKDLFANTLHSNFKYRLYCFSPKCFSVISKLTNVPIKLSALFKIKS